MHYVLIVCINPRLVIAVMMKSLTKIVSRSCRCSQVISDTKIALIATVDRSEHYFDEDGQCIDCRRESEYRRRSKRIANRVAQQP